MSIDALEYVGFLYTGDIPRDEDPLDLQVCSNVALQSRVAFLRFDLIHEELGVHSAGICDGVLLIEGWQVSKVSFLLQKRCKQELPN